MQTCQLCEKTAAVFRFDANDKHGNPVTIDVCQTCKVDFIEYMKSEVYKA